MLVAESCKPFDFLQDLGDERLTAVADFDGHHGDEVDAFQQVLHVGERGERVDGHARAAAVLVDDAQRAEGVRAQRFDVRGEHRGAGDDQLVDPMVGVGDHHVHFVAQCAQRQHLLDPGGAQTHTGREVAVHDIHMVGVSHRVKVFDLRGGIAEIAAIERNREMGC